MILLPNKTSGTDLEYLQKQIESLKRQVEEQLERKADKVPEKKKGRGDTSDILDITTTLVEYPETTTAGGSYTHLMKEIQLEGYEPVGIVGYHISNQVVHPYIVRIEKNNGTYTARMSVHNRQTSERTYTADVTVLWIRRRA